jgi:hypothetical protein
MGLSKEHDDFSIWHKRSGHVIYCFSPQHVTLEHLYNKKLRDTLGPTNFYGGARKAKPYFYRNGSSVMCASPQILDNVLHAKVFQGKSHGHIYSPRLKCAFAAKDYATLWPKDSVIVPLADAQLHILEGADYAFTEMLRIRMKHKAKQIGASIELRAKVNISAILSLIEGYEAYLKGVHSMSEVDYYAQLADANVAIPNVTPDNVKWSTIDLKAGEGVWTNDALIVQVPVADTPTLWCYVTLIETPSPQCVVDTLTKGIYGNYYNNRGITTHLSNRACMDWRMKR